MGKYALISSYFNWTRIIPTLPMTHKKDNILHFVLLFILLIASQHTNTMLVETDNTNGFATFMNAIDTYPDIKKEIALYLFNSADKSVNEAAIDKFMNMPIGQALEWYTFCYKLSRGKAPYRTPLFANLFINNDIIFPPQNDTYLKIVNTTAVYMMDRNSHGNDIVKKLGVLSPNKCLQSIQKKDISWGEDPQFIEGQALELLLNHISNKFFILSKVEMSTFIKMLILNYYYSDTWLLHSDIQNIRTINTKIVGERPTFYQEWRANFRFKSFNFIGDNDWILPAAAVLIIPVILTGMSRMIQQNILPVSIDLIVEENHLRELVNKAINNAHDQRLLKYCYPLLHNSETWTTELKINAPFFAPCLPFLCTWIWHIANNSRDIVLVSTLSSIGGLICSGICYGASCFLSVHNWSQFLSACTWSIGILAALKVIQICYNIYYQHHLQYDCKPLEDIIRKHWRIWNGGRVF